MMKNTNVGFTCMLTGLILSPVALLLNSIELLLVAICVASLGIGHWIFIAISDID